MPHSPPAVTGKAEFVGVVARKDFVGQVSIHSESPIRAGLIQGFAKPADFFVLFGKDFFHFGDALDQAVAEVFIGFVFFQVVTHLLFSVDIVSK